MIKKIFGLICLFVFIFSSAFIFTGEKESIKLKEASSAKIENKAEILYKLILSDNGEIVILALKGDKEEMVRSGKASPLRQKDEEILKEGIVTENLEKALMIFEDFIS